MTLTEILENGRAVTVDIGNQSVSTTGNQMSSRIPLHIEGSDNVIKKGFFTKNSFADPLVNRDRILAEFRQKYPDMSEKDVNFCCLVKINMSLQSLSDIYCISKNSVSRRKLRLKEKMGVGEDETLDDFLGRFI